MAKRLYIFFCCLFSVLSSVAQSEVQTLTLPQKQDSIKVELPPNEPLIVEPIYSVPYFTPSLFSTPTFNVPFTTTYQAPRINLSETSAYSLPQWLTFTSDVQEFPGMMQIESGSIAYVGNSGRFTYSAYAGAVKYGTFNSLVTSYYVGGQVSYSLNSNFSFTAFGTYYSVNPYFGMAAFPYVQTTNFGGYMTYAPNSKFAISVGARSHYDPFSNRMVIDPIIMPSFKIGKVKVDFDVGPATKSLLENLVHRRNKQIPVFRNP